MMNNPDEITLDVFGKILYALAMADGGIQKEEREALQKMVDQDDWAHRIKLSFDAAMNLEMDPKMVFYKNMRIFQTLKTDVHMPYFLDLMNRMANAYEGIVPEERALIENFNHKVNQSSVLV
ncbi:hypothetical protein KO507_03625 [Gilvimarinus agarilyticus]|nr:hypothetical protein [Reichenbachiella agariperforans]MBU2884853.1 hypothetical protein [Gilvimarinus agarilyticus]MBU2913023.1 hypothetical protein [Reichenbachiella agariperforans]